MVRHDVVFEALGAPARDAPLALVQRSDEDFLSGLLADLATAEGRAKLAGQAPAARGGVLELFQPVHRVFTLAVAELFCDEPGQPRLDPRKIDGAGLVVRRVRLPSATAPDELVEVNEGWLKKPDGTRRWTALPTRADELDRWDPLPARRRAPSLGNDAIDRRLREILRTDLDDAEEHVTTLFVAPPEVNRAAGRTFVYGLVPTASADTSASPPAEFSDADIDALLPQYLQVPPAGATGEPVTLPSDIRGKKLTRFDADRLEGRPFMTMLALLTVSFGLFPREAPPSPKPAALPLPLQVLGVPFILGPQLGLLAGEPYADRPAHVRKLLIALDRLTISGEPGSRFLERAARLLVWRNADVPAPDHELQMPDAWPQITPEIAAAIRDGMRPVLEAQAKRVVPNEGRFEVARAEYVARAFVRVKREDGCPPAVLWSEPSERFAIKPWHAASPLPPLRVTLPDLVPGTAKLEKLQPNVTFVVPKGLAAFLNGNTAKSLLKGAGAPAPEGVGLGWICGFNIPIITLCAFIVLSIFLSLLNIIFWWLPFVKICIPFPTSLRARLEERP